MIKKRIMVIIFIHIFCLFLIKNFNKTEDSFDNEMILLDGIAALRIGSSGLTPTYYSDTWFFTVFGKARTLVDIIIENIWISYGNEHGIKVVSNESSHEYAEQYLDMLQTQKNISRKDIEKMAEEYGYDINDIKKELNRQYIMQQTIDTHFAANSLLAISSSEIMEYYNTIPIKKTTLYSIRIGSLPISLENTIGDKSNINNIKIFFKNNKQKIVWEEPFQIKADDLNDNFRNINNHSIGDIIYFEKNSKKDHYLIYELVHSEEQEQSSDDLYEIITRQLQHNKYQESLNIVTKGFLESPFIKYDTAEIKNECLKSFF